MVGLVLAAVPATPLRMGQLLGGVGRAAAWLVIGVYRGARRVGGDVAGFLGEAIRAVLPEREQDEYRAEESAASATGAAAIDDLSGEQPGREPPIVDRSGRVVDPGGSE